MKISTKRVGLLLVLLAITIGALIFFNADNSRATDHVEVDKYARIEKAMELEIMKTKDLSTNQVPRERLMPIRSMLADLNPNAAIIPSLDWEERGPDNVGGRTRAILIDNANDPTNNTVIAAGVSGGIWKTTNFKDASPTWTPFNDFFENIAVSSLVQDPNNPDVMYFGTGEGWFNGDAVRGMGIWKSTDAGNSWSQLASTENPAFYYVQDLAIDVNGHLYASTREGGLRKSVDGGNTFMEVLSFAVGGTPTNRAADIEIGADGDIYVTMGIFSTGVVYKSDYQAFGAITGDPGTWTDITPPGNYWRIELATAPSDADVLYVTCQGLFSFDATAIFRSDDQGATWTDNLGVPTIIDQGSNSIYTRSQGWYDLIATVNPNDPYMVYIGGVDALRSVDGAETWEQITSWSLFAATGFGPEQNVHADHHMIVFEPGSSTNAIWGTDGGIDYTTDANNPTSKPSWVSKNTGYNVTQFYSCAISNEPGGSRILGGTQDNGTHYFTSPGVNSTVEVTGGDGGFCHIDQDNPQIQVSSFVFSNYFITNDNWATVQFINPAGANAGLFINPTDYDSDANILYGASFQGEYDFIENVGTTNDADFRSIPGMEGETISAVTVSPNVPNRVYFGTNEGKAFKIDDANSTPSTTEITITEPGSGGFISCIEVENGNDDHLILTYSNYGTISVWESTDGGSTWTNIEGNLPDMPVRWALINPLNNDQVLLATEMGVWSTNNLDGTNTFWGPTNMNLANTRVDMLQYSPADFTVVAATHGRGFYTTTDLQAGTPCDVSITSIDLTNPTDCDAMDGAVTITASGATNLEYSFDGGDNWTTNNSMNFSADLFPAGQFLARDADETTCVSIWNAQEILTTDPPATDFQIDFSDPYDCNDEEGAILIYDLASNATFDISLDNGVSFQSYTTNNDGEIVISGLTAGIYYIIVGQGNCFSQPQSFDLSARTEGGLSCNNKVSVTLDEECGAPLSPDAVLEGLYCDDVYYVKVAYPNDGHTLNEVVKCGEFKYVVYRVVGAYDYAYFGEDRASATDDEDPDEEVCWGYVNAEDKTPPTACIKKVVGIYKVSSTTFDPFSNSDDECNDNILPLSSVDDGNGYVDWEDPSINLLICTDVAQIQDVPASWNNPGYSYYTGFPEGFDNCGDATITWHEDILIDYECAYEEAPDFIEGRLVSSIIERTFRIVDEKGNESFITQEICFFKPIIELPDCKEHLDACWYADVDRENTEEELAPAVIESAPYYVNGICEKIYLDKHVCNVTVTFEDAVLPGEENCGFKIIRTWTFLDWCWDGFTYDGIELVGDPGDDCPEITPSSWDNKSFTYEQHIIIGDDEDPIVECPIVDSDWDGDGDPIIFTTGPFSCESIFEVPAPIVTNKECGYSYSVEIYTDVPVLWHGVPTGETERVLFKEAQITENTDPETGATNYIKAAGIPKGDHYFKYTVTDKCGNYGESEMCPFSVIDNLEPSAVCDDQLNVSVGTGVGNESGLGYARVYAEDVDEGSWDNCSPVFIQIRRFVPQDIADLFVAGSDLTLVGYPNNPTTLNKEGVEANGQRGFYTNYGDYVDFICGDVGQKVVIELGVWDDADMNGLYEPGKDNFNSCWLETLVEDKINPICEAPHDVTLKCTEVPYFATLPQDGTKWSALSESEQENIKRWFSALQDEHKSYPSAWDNCEADVAMIDVRFNLHCKAGTVTRIFQATDAFGRQSATCSQVITLTRFHDYCITFPKDAEATCGNDPNIQGVAFDEQGCDLLAVSTQDEHFEVPTSSDECYKIFRTYRVLNWCQFEEDLDIPGGEGDIGENDDVNDVYFDFTYFDRFTEIPPFIVSRDEDDDGNPGDENVTVRFITDEGQPGGGHGTIYVDRNCDPRDGNPSVNGGYWRKADTPQGTNSGTTLVAGFYQYTQVIKVYDDVAPVQAVIGETDFPSYTTVNPGEEDKLCTGIVNVMIEVTELCAPDGIRVVNEVVLHPDPALGLGPIVIYNDGNPTAQGTELFGFDITGPESTGEMTRKFTLNGEFPIGDHDFEITVKDGCGNGDADFVNFTVFDAKAPVPICISGITTDLMPLDEDNNGTIDGGMITIWASDFIASDIADCSGIEYISIHKATDIDGGAEPDSKQSSIDINCEDGEIIIVYIYAWDGAGNNDRCEAMLLVNDNMGLCDPQVGSAVIAGNISSENDIPASDVQVNLSGQMTQNLMTSDQGTYSFNGLEMGYDYTLTPLKDIDHREGVSTLDLVVISKHILGVETLDSPYKMIAADVNASKSITTLDLITLRKLILNIETQFNNNTSWRFVDAKYIFPNPANPWAEPFPEIINLNNMESNMIDGDFVILKVGDVNGSAKINRTIVDDRNIAGTFTIDVEDQSFVTGNEYSVAFTAADLAKVDGYQFTLNLSADVALVDVEYGVAKAENFGFIEDKVITTSWNGAATDEVLFTLVLRANADVALSDAMNISSRYTVAEAYNKGGELLDVAINFGGAVSSSADFALYQNTPNPFNGETVIGFNLPEAGEATISVSDITGKVLHIVRGDFNKGYNQVTIAADQLATGILSYTLTSNDLTVSKQMIVLE